MTYYTKRKHIPLRGFSLVELVVSLVVIGIVYGMLFANLPRTNSRVDFQSQVATVRSMILSAQIFGASQGGDAQGRGVYLEIGNQDVIEFLDASESIVNELGIKESNKYYDSSDTIMATTTLPFSVVVQDIQDVNGTPLGGVLSITFVRPSTNAHLVVNGDEANPLDSVVIVFESTAVDDLCAEMTILKIGQVSVTTGSCAP